MGTAPMWYLFASFVLLLAACGPSLSVGELTPDEREQLVQYIAFGEGSAPEGVDARKLKRYTYSRAAREVKSQVWLENREEWEYREGKDPSFLPANELHAVMESGMYKERIDALALERASAIVADAGE